MTLVVRGRADRWLLLEPGSVVPMQRTVQPRGFHQMKEGCRSAEQEYGQAEQRTKVPAGVRDNWAPAAAAAPASIGAGGAAVVSTEDARPRRRVELGGCSIRCHEVIVT